MAWTVILCDPFDEEVQGFDQALQEEFFAVLRVLEMRGPTLGRPYVDQVKGSRYPNMKELRIQHGGSPYRYLFIFDPQRQAVVLVGGCKVGDTNFYARNIRIAEKRYEEYLRTAC